MLDSWAPVGSRNVNTIRSHPNAFTIRNRKETRKRDTDTQNRHKTFADFKVGFGTAAYRLQPWSSDLELIEGKCGSGITSYFIFLRRLISLNLVLSLISLSGLILPFFITKQLSGHVPVDSDGCDYPAPVAGSGFLQQISLFFAGQGALEGSFFFYGYYESDAGKSESGYNLALFYIVTTCVIFLASLVAISIHAGQGIEKTIVGKSGQMFKYSNLILSGWDCNISDRDTGRLKKRLRFLQIRNELKEDQLRGKQKNWTVGEKVWVYLIRVLTTLFNLIILALCIIAIVLAATQGKVLARSEQVSSNLLKLVLEYLVPITMGGTSILAPVFFKLFISVQRLRAETRINQVLGWRVALRFLSLSALFITLFLEVANCNMPNEVIDHLREQSVGMNFTEKIMINHDVIMIHDDAACSCADSVFLCWPVVLGQECFKLTIGWLLGQLGTVLCLAAPARIWHKYAHYRIPLISCFDITDNVLKIVSWQTVVWLGFFYCPVMPLLVLLVQLLVFYVNRIAVLYIYLPDEPNYYKSSTEGNFFTVLLVVGFYLAALVTISATILLPPSPHCGPFQQFEQFSTPFLQFIQSSNSKLTECWNFATSKPVLYTAIVLVFGVIYFYQVRSSGLAERIRVLEQQLKKEEEDKQFLILRKRNRESSQPPTQPTQRSSNSRPSIIENANMMRDGARRSSRHQPIRNSRMETVLNDEDAALREIQDRNSHIQHRQSHISWT